VSGTYLPHIRRLSFFLLLSVIANITLGCFLFYWLFFKERPPTPVCEKNICLDAKKMPSQTFLTDAKPLILALKKRPIPDLVKGLRDDRLVENGYTVADFSLAALSNFYYFDITRAGGRPLEEKVMAYGDKGETITLYPGLSQEDFQNIEKFLQTEKWPFKSQGLFKLLKSSKFRGDISLQESFFLTPEFLSVEILMARAPEKPSRHELLALVLSAPWGQLAAFNEKQKASLDLNDGQRRTLLLDYLKEESAPAAELLLKTDFDFALRKLDDKTTILLLSLLTEKNERTEKYAKEILKSPRSDSVRRSATARLYEYAGQTLPENIDLAEAALKFVPQPLKIVAPLKPIPQPVKEKAVALAPPPPKVQPAPPKKEKIYVVQAQDTIWKIAQRFNVSPEDIVKLNKLPTTKLKTGAAIKIPVNDMPKNKARI
jgi:LysM repeat protein